MFSELIILSLWLNNHENINSKTYYATLNTQNNENKNNNTAVAVYYARAMLRLNIEDVLPQLRKAYTQQQAKQNTAVVSNLTAYPNPTQNTLTIVSNQPFESGSMLIIENTIGNTLQQFNLPVNNNNFSFSTLSYQMGFIVVS